MALSFKSIYSDSDGIPRVFGYGATEQESLKQATLALGEYLRDKHSHGIRISSDAFTATTTEQS